MLYSETLIKEAQEGNKTAFNKLANVWYPRIYNFSYKYFANHDTAMEVTQQTFITVYKKLDTLKEVESFKSWIYRIVSNLCHNEQKKLKRKSWFSIFRTDDEDEPMTIDFRDDTRDANPEENMAQNEASQLLEKALSRLSEEQRVIVIMKEYEGLKFSEIAEILNISENTAKSRLYYGLNALRKIFDGWNLSKEKLYSL